MRKKVAFLGIVGLIVALAVTNASAVTGNLVVNGNFEEPVVTGILGWDIYPSGDPGIGWMAEWVGDYPGAPSPANIELHNRVILWSSASGDQHTELDSDWDGPTGSMVGEQASIRLYQDLPTCPGGIYALRYYWSPRPLHADNVVEVWWGDELIATHEAAGSETTRWTEEFSAGLVASDGVTRLAFVEVGNPDAMGMFIDNVSVVGLICKQEVEIEVKPTCCTETPGAIEVSILGSADLDVTEIDAATLRYGGAPVLTADDGAPMCGLGDVGGPGGSAPDGYDDLVCMFDSNVVLIGELYDGTTILGSDEVCCDN